MDPARRHVLRFPKPNAEGVRLHVNGSFVTDIWGDPFEANCTEFLKAGENRIQAGIYSTLGNTLGFTHCKAPWVDPANAAEEFFLQPLGLGGAAILRIFKSQHHENQNNNQLSEAIRFQCH